MYENMTEECVVNTRSLLKMLHHKKTKVKTLQNIVLHFVKTTGLPTQIKHCSTMKIGIISMKSVI